MVTHVILDISRADSPGCRCPRTTGLPQDNAPQQPERQGPRAGDCPGRPARHRRGLEPVCGDRYRGDRVVALRLLGHYAAWLFKPPQRSCGPAQGLVQVGNGLRRPGVVNVIVQVGSGQVDSDSLAAKPQVALASADPRVFRIGASVEASRLQPLFFSPVT